MSLLSVSFCIIVLLVGYCGAVICDSDSCFIDCSEQDCNEIVCTENASSCTILCDDNDCSNSSIYLSASNYNGVICTGNDSCSSSSMYCGIDNNNINECFFYFPNNLMNNVYIECINNVNLCNLYTSTGISLINETNDSIFYCSNNIQCKCNGDYCNYIDLTIATPPAQTYTQTQTQTATISSITIATSTNSTISIPPIQTEFEAAFYISLTLIFGCGYISLIVCCWIRCFYRFKKAEKKYETGRNKNNNNDSTATKTPKSVASGSGSDTVLMVNPMSFNNTHIYKSTMGSHSDIDHDTHSNNNNNNNNNIQCTNNTKHIQPKCTTNTIYTNTNEQQQQSSYSKDSVHLQYQQWQNYLAKQKQLQQKRAVEEFIKINDCVLNASFKD